MNEEDEELNSVDNKDSGGERDRHSLDVLGWVPAAFSPASYYYVRRSGERKRERMGFARNEGGRRDVYFIVFYRRLKFVFREACASEAVGSVCCVVALCWSVLVTDSLFVRDCYILLFVFNWCRLLFVL